MKQTLLLTFLLLALCGCTSLPENPVKSDSWPQITPDYTGVTIPSDIAPLNFYIDDDDVDLLDVVIRSPHGEALHSNGAYADFELDEWHSLIQQNRGDSLLYQRNLSNFEQTPIIENKLVDGDCMNCHTPNRTDPSQFTFHVRGEHGATVIRKGQGLEVLAPRNQELGGSMVYPFWHPSGQFIAYSTNQTHQNFHQLSDRRVEVYDDKSDIIIYNTDSHEIQLDSIIATSDHLENYPVFSPDGKSLYFCAADAIDSIWTQYQDIKYNICRIDFDAETGSLGQKVDTIVNARQQGKSANMPRISYDGRFLLYTLSDYGCFPIWHPEADLWMMDLTSGENYPLTAVNSHDSESFHNWSLNSRWILFTSRRDDGLYTQLYLAHIDADGKASKPFRLPQQNPREFDLENIYSFNTPEFTKSTIEISEEQISQQLMLQERINTALRKQQ